MNTEKPMDPLDKRIDDLLSSKPVRASADFRESTLARLHEEVAGRRGEEGLDAFLAGSPLAAAPDFTAQTLSRIRKADLNKRPNTITFPQLIGWISTVAAVFLLGFWGFYYPGPQPVTQPASPPVVETAPTPVEENPSAMADSGDFIASENVFGPDMDELFLLVDTLGETALLDDEEAFDTLTFLAMQ